MIDQIIEENGSCRILDIGGTEGYWLPASTAAPRWSGRVHITMVNLIAERVRDHSAFTAVQADGCDLPMFADNSFDLVHSNSVIEHVGDNDRCGAFARETRRIGRAYWVQTPNRYFPYEPHYRLPFGQFLPAWAIAAVLRYRMVGFVPREHTWKAALASVRSNRLLSRRFMKRLFPDAEIVSEKLGGLTKSLIAVQAWR